MVISKKLYTGKLSAQVFVSAFSLLIVSLGLMTTGCASWQKSSERPISEIPQNIPEEGYKPAAQYGNVSLDQNAKVEQWISYFTGRGRKYMHIYLERSARYIPMMKATFRERGMPDELAYVAMIESGFSPTAFSQASAVGYWQFIRETGKRYNLRIDPYVDERRDPILSTQSAATYLDSLYSIFGDWHLALAAYNAGEGRILHAVMKKRTRDFWELTAIRKALPKETANYIPKFIAAVMIAKDPAKYGFTDIDFQPAFSFDSVVIDKPMSLETLATELNVDYQAMQKMNPRYKSDYVPVYSDRVNAVRVPVGMKDLAVSVMAKCVSEAPKRYIASFEFYKIRRGDTLSHIARRYHTSIARIKDLNDFSSRTLLRVGKRIKVPDGVVSMNSKSSELKKEPVRSIASRNKKAKNVAKVAVNRNSSDENAQSKTHVVRRGENLSTIARRYSVSVAQLAKANALSHRSKLFVGAELTIPN